MNKTILSLAIATPMVAATSCAECTEAEKPVNVIVVLADDLGYGDMSAYGSTTINTPNLDRIANAGLRFTDGHATSSTSTPSRYALFTGVYPWKNPNAHILSGDAPLIIGVDQFTMPKMFKSKGYRTGAIGKWHLGMGSGNPNWNQTIKPGAKEIGFDYSCLIAATNDRVPTVYVENGDVVGLDPNDPIEVSYKQNFEGEPTAISNPELLSMEWSHGHNNSIVNGIPRIGYMKGGESAKWVDEDMADYFFDKVKNFIEESRDEPFFLYYGLHQPHVPRAPHSRFVGSTGLGARGDAIAEADWCFGELIKKLEEEGLLENTLILFSSDNGPVLNDGYKDEAIELLGDHTPAGELRGGKYSRFEAGTRVPFFAYWKGKIKPAVSDALISHLDLLASFATLIGAELPEDKDLLDSQDHLELLLGRSDEGRQNLVLNASKAKAYRSGKYAFMPVNKGPKYNQTKNELGNAPTAQLYDLSTDLGQEINIADENPALVEQFTRELNEITNKP